MSEIKRIINVIPLTRTSLAGPQIFTYSLPHKFDGQMRPGQLIRIPFGKKKVFGITTSHEMRRITAETRGLRDIDELLDHMPIISEKQIRLAEWISQYFVCPLGLVLKLFIPKPTKTQKPPSLPGYERHNPDFVLTEKQRQAVFHIANSLGKFQRFLLFGVTGSGKTEVYMQIIERVLETRRQVLILVPEISLTEQAIERYGRRFGMENIAVVHSQIKATEKSFTWKSIAQQQTKIIIGPRSALFAPFANLGLVVIDEEHDPSFKQADQHPKYHAVAVAKKLAELWTCPLILGDATPSLENYHLARTKQIRFLHLPHRIKADKAMPRVLVVDMLNESRKKQQAGIIFSEYLEFSMLDCLRKDRQIILFINRRGASTLVICRDCGFVPRCENCAVNLVWHDFFGKLQCHHCARFYDGVVSCPNCRGVHLRYAGIGTESVEKELKNFLVKNNLASYVPKIIRMDQDTTALVGASAKFYDSWQTGKAKILVGTQIVSKGWDISNVNLVGIISADTSLVFPDFRANERTFQIFTQVSGRTGRGQEPGVVILQTYYPDNYAIAAVKTHDYELFYQPEIAERRRLAYPPFSRLIRITVKHREKPKAQDAANQTADKLKTKIPMGIEVIGPYPALIFRLRGNFQFQILLRIPEAMEFDHYRFFRSLAPMADVDVDPISVL